jgi:hypothetical protein
MTYDPKKKNLFERRGMPVIKYELRKIIDI